MQIEIGWSENARLLLDQLYAYQAKQSEVSAIRLYNRFLDEVEILRTFPQAGPIEPILKDHPDCFRYLVVAKNYKIIYTITDDLIEIHAVWDCRQEESRLKKMFK